MIMMEEKNDLNFDIADARYTSAFYADKAKKFADKAGCCSEYNLFLSEHYAKDAEILERLRSYEDKDLVDRQLVLSYIDRVTNSGLGKHKALEYIRKYVENM